MNTARPFIICFSILLVVSTFFPLSYAQGLQTTTYDREAILLVNTVAVGSPASFSVDYGFTFSTIDSVCFVFSFTGDLLDPGEGLGISSNEWVFPVGAFGIGFTNVFAFPQQERTICIVKELHPLLVATLLDGSLNGVMAMDVGSVTIQLLKMSISGVRVVTIDVKPGSSVNSVNINSLGVMPVAILTTTTFDATTVDPSTVRFGRTGTEATTATPPSIADVNSDGTLDLVLHFSVTQCGFKTGDTQGILTAKTFEGRPMYGVDTVRVLRPPSGTRGV